MQKSPLASIERSNLVLGLGVTAAAGLLGGPRAFIATAAGAAVGAANFWALRRLGSGAVARALDEAEPADTQARTPVHPSTARALALTGALLAKMAVLFAAVWAGLRLVGLDALPFTVGLSVFVVSCLAVGFSARPRDGGAPGDVACEDGR